MVPCENSKIVSLASSIIKNIVVFSALSKLADKVTTGTYNFVSVIASFPSPVELVITQSLDHVKIRLTSQLINVISSVLQNLLKCFNGTIISTSFVFPLLGVFPVIFT